MKKEKEKSKKRKRKDDDESPKRTEILRIQGILRTTSATVNLLFPAKVKG